MVNVEYKVEKAGVVPVLVIRVNLNEEHGRSASGKTTIIASTQGNQRIEGTDAIMGLNVYKR